jgi:hypothetical protein
MATKLGVYQRALRMCGHRALSSVTESVEARLLLDAEYDGNSVSALRSVLSLGQWRFAAKTLSIASTGTESFGLTKTFPIPSDFVSVIAIASDGNFRDILTEDAFTTDVATSYRRDAAKIFAAQTPIYLRQVSDDATTYGGKIADWPDAFENLFAAWMALRIAPALTKNKALLDNVAIMYERSLIEALDKEAIGGALRYVALRAALTGGET